MPDETKQAALEAIERMEFPTGTRWVVGPCDYAAGNYIRATVGNRTCCPLTAWYEKRGNDSLPMVAWMTAARLLGISEPAGDMIAAAADDVDGYNPEIRAALLAKCNLEEID